MGTDQAIVFGERDSDGLTVVELNEFGDCWVIRTGGEPWAIAGSRDAAIEISENLGICKILVKLDRCE